MGPEMDSKSPSRHLPVTLAHYGTLHREGTLIGDVDLVIAATARVHRLVLATHNTRHFQHIAERSLVNWLDLPWYCTVNFPRNHSAAVALPVRKSQNNGIQRFCIDLHTTGV